MNVLDKKKNKKKSQNIFHHNIVVKKNRKKTGKSVKLKPQLRECCYMFSFWHVNLLKIQINVSTVYPARIELAKKTVEKTTT